MIKDKLKINDEKSEFILISSQAQLKVDIDELAVGDSWITTSTDAIRNLGDWFDTKFTVSPHVTKTFKAGFFYLYDISRIRNFFTREIMENLIHAFATRRLDYCNSLLYALLNCLISSMQRIHIIPLLTELHWLNFKHRIDLQIILITYKAIHGTSPKYIKNLVSLK